jgi:hypothetical protein
LDRLGDVGGLDFFGASEVGDGAADFEDPAVDAGAQAQLIVGKPPALLGDSQSLTFAGVERKPPNGEPLRLNQEEAQ